MRAYEFLTEGILTEGGNLRLPGGDQAEQIDLKVTNRSIIVPILNQLLSVINSQFAKVYKRPLWDPKLLQSLEFLSGSSLHFFNVKGISDEDFVAKKPKVGDIDTQVDVEIVDELTEFLNSVQGKNIGPAVLLGYEKGNEQYSSLWQLVDVPIKIQIDLEFVRYADSRPTDWSRFSHSSSWEDLSAGIKGVFHKYMMRALTSVSSSEKYVARQLKKGIKISDTPEVDSDYSFAVSSKTGGGLRKKYTPLIDPETGRPVARDGIPVMLQIPSAEGEYEQDLSKQFEMLFGRRPNNNDVSQMWSFVGQLQLANKYLSADQRQVVAEKFSEILFGPGAQGMYRDDPVRDRAEKMAALELMVNTLKGIDKNALLAKAEQDSADYYSKYKVSENILEAEVVAQKRRGMPHLRDLKPADFLDLLEEIYDGHGNFRLQNIPLNVKIDGFGGRFGKDSDGRPFMATSRSEPQYRAGFLEYNKKKGTTDPEVLDRAKVFDQLFDDMMSAIKLVDSKLGRDYLVDRQVICEVLYLPFAVRTESGRLRFVGIEYDELPKGVKMVLVPVRVTDASTGEDVPNQEQMIKELSDLGRTGSIMFLSNRLAQAEPLDVTAIVPPMENIQQFKDMLASRKRDRAAAVKQALGPIMAAFENAVISDPNILGKDVLGKDYEGIVINSRLGPIKVTSQQQRDVIAAKASKAAQKKGPAKTAVVAIGSFVGHIGHEQLWQYTLQKAAEVKGDPYLFIGHAVGADDPIPPAVKVQTWHKLYPNYKNNISTVGVEGGSLMQKIKHELINPTPGQPPRYDRIIIMVGEDQAKMTIAQALMRAVNKFPGYEHVTVELQPTPRGTGMSFTRLRNILKDPSASAEEKYALWSQAFDAKKLGSAWIKHLMDVTAKGMGLTKGISEGSSARRTNKPTDRVQRTRSNVRESLRPGEYYLFQVTTDDGQTHQMPFRSDEGFQEHFENYWTKRGRQVISIVPNWSIQGFRGL